jgi:two-component sensor histidine kinase
MIAAPHPLQDRRLAALYELEILDTEQEVEFDELARLAAAICNAPIGVVNLIDADRQWFKAETGLGVRSTPLDTSLCSHVILQDQFTEIGDTLLDPRMADNPLCAGEEGLRFYAGAVLQSEDGLPLGTLCVLDREPRQLTEFQRGAVEALARQATRLLDLRLALKRQDLLTREIDHRVKNSLAAIGGIVRLQSARSDHPEVKEALAVVQSRLAAVTALHEQLHLDTRGAAMDLGDFLVRLGMHLQPLLPEGVRLHAAGDPLAVSSHVASTIGLLVNEFVANAGKHGQEIRSVRIEGRRGGANYILTCCDDGLADAATLAAIVASRGLGARIINASASTLGGSAEWKLHQPGLGLELVFPAES